MTLPGKTRLHLGKIALLALFPEEVDSFKASDSERSKTNAMAIFICTGMALRRVKYRKVWMRINKFTKKKTQLMHFHLHQIHEIKIKIYKKGIHDMFPFMKSFFLIHVHTQTRIYIFFSFFLIYLDKLRWQMNAQSECDKFRLADRVSDFSAQLLPLIKPLIMACRRSMARFLYTANSLKGFIW